MNIGQKLLDLRKSKQLSQEEVANILNVTRQTISKWETDQSMPDFDKILPICQLYGISADELLSGIKSEKTITQPIENDGENNKNNEQYIREKRAKGIGIGVILYFIAVAWIMISIPVQKMDPIIATAGFLLICGIATYALIYTNIVYKKEKEPKDEPKNKLQKQINEIIAIIVLVIYLVISFTTMAWHITWILWIVYGLVEEIVKLIFILRGKKDGE